MDAIKWFRDTQEKNNKTLLKGDIKAFYPSIKPTLLAKACEHFRQSGVDITRQEEQVIMQAKEQIAHGLGKVWIKKQGSFDNSMGSKDGSEVAELVGLYLLSKFESDPELQDAIIALYRDDLIAIVPNNGFRINRIRSAIQRIVALEELDMTDWTEGRKLDYLDIEFDMADESFRPHTKPMDGSRYVSPMSDHPKMTIRSIPTIVEKRISMLCSSREVHDREKEAFQAKLRRDGHGNIRLKFLPQLSQQEMIARHNEKRDKRKKARQIIWFNPVYTRRLAPEAAVGKAFFDALDSSFPEGSNLKKILNRNHVKLSYRNMPSFEAVVNSVNKVNMETFNKSKFLEEEASKRANQGGKRGRPKHITKPSCN